MKTKTTLMELGYKGYYHELSDWFADYIRATSRQDALRKFARQHRMGRVSLRNAKQWEWWEGDWFMSFRYVKPADTKPCPSCQGAGRVFLDQDR